MNFEFATAGRILFGAGQVEKLADLAASLGSRALFVTGKTTERALPLARQLGDRGIESDVFAIDGEPAIAAVQAGVAAAKGLGADLIVGFGGGSAIDAGKAIAALATNPGEPLDYLEVIGHGRPLTEKPLPSIAVPTTSGTGAEVTKNAVLASPDHRVKVSLRHPLMLPDFAIVDPTLTHSLPPEVTATTGMDALTQLIEPFTCCRTNPLTDGLCREGIRRAARSLRRAFHDGSDAEAREDMAVASLFGGLALANAGLGAVHGFAGPIGGMFPAPHGAVCAALLPHVVRTNIAALTERATLRPTLDRYREVAALLVGDPGATLEQAIEWLEALRSDLNIPALSSFGVMSDDFDIIAEKSARASSMKANPLELTHDELRGILSAAV